ncbi:MAG: hypothetical protein J0I54_12675 [Bosea sp.]|uniref:hypothetical protein n=1 Tax=unclassified Bosea (in: a-proteobacteria) TaxID=2653178 RepID=UPI001ACF4B16|nr:MULTISPECIES: hypothetical protein [unclassified Bosea (in: a-proteobacteria)]MBN9457475.1 hypothetical protein [Bosea sp. (in: a-proteobacteria)]
MRSMARPAPIIALTHRDGDSRRRRSPPRRRRIVDRILVPHDLIAAAHRAQAHAIEIEAQAKRRLADEYDAAQKLGEVGQRTGRPKVVPEQNDLTPPSAAEVGFTRKQIHEARQIRDAEAALPGIVRRILDEKLAGAIQSGALHDSRARGGLPASRWRTFRGCFGGRLRTLGE